MLIRIQVLLYVGLVCGSAMAQPLDTSFTFQGELQESAAPAVGDYEFEFELFDAESGGNSTSAIIGQTLAVNDGIFTTRLDFGGAPFVGDSVWLEVRVRPSGTGGFTTLLPRQAIVNAPYAVHSQFVGANGVTGASVVDGSLGGADLAPGSVGSAQVDSSEVQLRLTTACAAGEAIRAVDSSGNVTCESLDDGDWFSNAQANTTNKRVAIGSFGYTGAQLYVPKDSIVGQPQLELRELGRDYTRLLMSTSVPDSSHYGFWTIAARTEPETFGGPQTDRINFFNSRQGDLMVLLGNGNLGLGVFNPTARLDVNGGARIRGLADASASSDRIVQVDANGNLVASAATSLRRVAIGHVAFRPGSSSGTYQYTAGTYKGGTGSTERAVADVQVPDGARMTAVRAWILDNSSGKNIEIVLLSSGVAGNSAAVLATIRSTGSGTGLNYREFVDSPTGPVVSNENPLNLSVRPVIDGTSTPTTWDADLGISAVVIEYEPPTP